MFGFLNCGDSAYTKVIADASPATLYPIIERKVVLGVSSIQTSGEVITCWMYLNSSISVSIILRCLQTRTITSTGSRVSGRRCPAGYVPIPDREAKRHMRKSYGVPKEHSGLFLKEHKYRFNNPKPQA